MNGQSNITISTLPAPSTCDITYDGYVTAKYNSSYKPNLSGRNP